MASAKVKKSAKGLFNDVSAEDLLAIRDGKLVVGGKILSPDTTSVIIEEAKALMGMSLWKYLLKDMKHQANKFIYEKAKDMDDIWFGKGGLYMTAVVEQRLAELAKMESTLTPK